MSDRLKKKNEKLMKSLYLRNINPDNVPFDKMQEIRQEQDKLYHEWNFQNELSKAMERIYKEKGSENDE